MCSEKGSEKSCSKNMFVFDLVSVSHLTKQVLFLSFPQMANIWGNTTWCCHNQIILALKKNHVLVGLKWSSKFEHKVIGVELQGKYWKLKVVQWLAWDHIAGYSKLARGSRSPETMPALGLWKDMYRWACQAWSPQNLGSVSIPRGKASPSCGAGLRVHSCSYALSHQGSQHISRP